MEDDHMEIEIHLNDHYMDGQMLLEHDYMEGDYMEIEIPLQHHSWMVQFFWNMFTWKMVTWRCKFLWNIIAWIIKFSRKMITWKMITWRLKIRWNINAWMVKLHLGNDDMEDDYMEIELPLKNYYMDIALF